MERTTGGAAHGAQLPMLVFMHGLGDHPRADWLPAFDFPARVIFPQAPTPYGKGYAWFDFHGTASDPERRAGAISAAAAQVARMLQQLVRDRPTAGKPVVTGFSQGGMLSYAVALHHPQAISRAFPVAGSLPPSLWRIAPGAQVAPIVAWHGDADPIVPLGPTQTMVDSLALHHDVQLHVVPGVGHRIPTPLFQTLETAWAEALQPLR